MHLCMFAEELKVKVHGDFLPRQLFGMFHLLFAAMRCLYLALWLFFACPFYYDIIFVDQIPYSIPILKHCARRIVFYCHFPDRYLAPKSANPLRKLAYRHWFDRWEAATILLAHTILVNSRFTAKMFVQAFPSAIEEPAVLNPGVSIKRFEYQTALESSSFPWPEYPPLILGLHSPPLS